MIDRSQEMHTRKKQLWTKYCQNVENLASPICFTFVLTTFPNFKAWSRLGEKSNEISVCQEFLLFEMARSITALLSPRAGAEPLSAFVTPTVQSRLLLENYSWLEIWTKELWYKEEMCDQPFICKSYSYICTGYIVLSLKVWIKLYFCDCVSCEHINMSFRICSGNKMFPDKSCKVLTIIFALLYKKRTGAGKCCIMVGWRISAVTAVQSWLRCNICNHYC